MHKRLRRADNAAPQPVKTPKLANREQPLSSPVEHGDGTSRSPYRLPLRKTPNASGCLHCPTHTCHCVWFGAQLEHCYASLSLKRETERIKKRELCAKSILPPFVTRLIRIANVAPGETFYDLGCGNGSVLFQVAALTGARCVGVEINPHNAEVANAAWAFLRPIFEAQFKRELSVEIVCADFCTLLRDAVYFPTPCVIWAANLLLPRPVNHYLSERLRSVPRGTRIMCFEDMYPHSRSLARLRDPDAFEKFDMLDYEWQPDSVEWCSNTGRFFLYVKRT
ncbi:putative histone-lysine N-methyltransferase [Leishmania major strain Friedlin]|uniref:Histone-lysine N-methyltransferase, H3 lysine-79 specific n=1 Tax=Leishmania major TaxID=5664 RepID=Q4QD41_LEIMA|nr:putative histone-lysine N-methyltransferase [Leishmania major strain Friedlin]CAG9573074.1 histone-lysine_N-methyltransferase_-_putative [Leishmania major strain Friedlin]CAJ03506.1 putative histone-lysine N-methyltransferase [Leishmania major strain Friedlin]|eukprot:XP_001682757.1 putative histone-lysine N-methyltransferase [Leishmania major strain Friedlin]